MKFSVKPRKERLDQIRSWLQEEKESIGHSFICNFNIISDCYDEGNLHCVTKGKETLAFCVYRTREVDSEILIAVVDPKVRRTGAGRTLIEHHIRHLAYEGVRVLTLECQPRESEAFWSKVGFKKMPEGIDRNYSPPLRMWLPTVDSAVLSPNEGDLGLIELWNCPPWDAGTSSASWSWALDSQSVKETPIIFPAHRDWNIRWVKNGEVRYVGEFKRFCQQTQRKQFLILDSEPIVNYCN